MNRICEECPIAETCDSDLAAYQEGLLSGLFFRTVQNLTGMMIWEIRNNPVALTEDRFDKLLQEAISQRDEGNDPTGEANYLRCHPDLVSAVYNCELKIKLGQCSLHAATVPGN